MNKDFTTGHAAFHPAPTKGSVLGEQLRQQHQSRIAELERKLLIARKGLFWIQVRAACDAGDPCADKIAQVATDHLAETNDANLQS